MSEFPKPAVNGPGESCPFPYRSDTWTFEQPSARELHERLAVATVAADIGTWDLDVLSDSLLWCQRCARIFGAPSPPRRWRASVFELIHVEDRDRVQSAIEAALDPSGTGVFDTEFRVVRPDGEIRWIASNGKAFFELAKGTRTAIRFLGTLLDRTEQKLAHEALVASEKLAVTGRLAVTIAHEIKNPLDAVTNLLYIIRHERSAEKMGEYIVLAEAELGRLNEIASNTLRFYQDPIGLVTLDVGNVIESVLVLFRGRISTQQVRVQTEHSAGIGVQAPQGELRQVLVNLIGNALDAMPTGGRLIVRARELVGKLGQRCVRLTVADTGIGMPPEVLSRVFEAFYTTKKATGTGIGLWLSQEIVSKCGSKIHVKSTPGRGTVFSLYLPAWTKPADILPSGGAAGSM
jgi:signal transduction histidine kinase